MSKEETKAEKPKRLSPGGSKIFSRLPEMTGRQKLCAKRYSPFKDPEPPGFRSVEYKPTAVRVSCKTVDNGAENMQVEWRGQIPGGCAAFRAAEESEVMI